MEFLQVVGYFLMAKFKKKRQIMADSNPGICILITMVIFCSVGAMTLLLAQFGQMCLRASQIL